ncbi:hypothetical protein [Enterococcus faecalis]|nr:hypothetical protein [Enterococcus faecalis]
MIPKFQGGLAMNKQEKEDLIQALCDIGGCDAEDEWWMIVNKVDTKRVDT